LDKAWQVLESDIDKYILTVRKITITGDFNVRTLPDQYHLSWYSKDQAISENGMELVDLCISANPLQPSGQFSTTHPYVCM